MRTLKSMLLIVSLTFIASTIMFGVRVFLHTVNNLPEKAHEEFFLVILFSVLSIPPSILLGVLSLHDLAFVPEEEKSEEQPATK